MSPKVNRDGSVDEENEMADFGQDHNAMESLDRGRSPRPLLPMQSLGEPSSKPPVTLLDVATIALALVAFAIAVAVIWIQEAAVFLGQTNQLVVVGFALSVMNLAAQRQIQLAAIVAEVQYGYSKLANLDALLRQSLLSRRLSLVPRLALLVLIALPLSLSAAYKKFSGGFSTSHATFNSSQWGFVSRPGWPWSGNGLSGAIDAYVPFWNEVDIGRTYGYNLFVASNTTAALLDTPEWGTIYGERSRLRPRGYVILNTTVNATVAEHTEIQPSDREDPGYWESLRGRGFRNTTIDMSFQFYSGIFVSLPQRSAMSAHILSGTSFVKF